MNAGGFVRDPIEVGVLVEIFADALKIYLHVGITYKNKDFFFSI